MNQPSTEKPMTMAQMLNAPIIVIDPDTAGRIYTIKNLSEQQLEALDDCDFIIVHPLLNLFYKEGSWEPIQMGEVTESTGVMLVRWVS